MKSRRLTAAALWVVGESEAASRVGRLWPAVGLLQRQPLSRAISALATEDPELTSSFRRKQQKQQQKKVKGLEARGPQGREAREPENTCESPGQVV